MLGASSWTKAEILAESKLENSRHGAPSSVDIKDMYFTSINTILASSSEAAATLAAFFPFAGVLVGIAFVFIVISFVLGLPDRLYWFIKDRKEAKRSGSNELLDPDLVGGRERLYVMREEMRRKKRVRDYLNS